MILACRTSSYAPFEAIALEHLAGLGVRNVELRLPANDEVELLRRQLRIYELRATTIHGQCDASRADLPTSIAEQMKILAAFDTRYLFVSVKLGDTPAEVAYERLKRAGDIAAAHGVTIVLETHPELVTNGDVALETMRRIAHPNVRINYDTANVYFYNHGIDGVNELRKCVDYVAAVHLKDTDGGYRHWNFPALGRGLVDFRAAFRVLDEAGFAGPCTLEIEGLDGEQRTERMVCDRIAESVGYLRGLGRL